MNTELLGPWLQERMLMLALLAAVAFLDMVGGALIGIKAGSFKLEKLPEFFKTFFVWTWVWMSAELLSFLPVLFGVTVSGLVALLTTYSGNLVYAGIILKYVASILVKAQNTGALNGRTGDVLTKIGMPPDAQG